MAAWLLGDMQCNAEATLSSGEPLRGWSAAQVALLFLTKGPLPHAALWAAWLGQAAGLLPADCAAAAACSAAATAGARRVTLDGLLHSCTNGRLQRARGRLYSHSCSACLLYQSDSNVTCLAIACGNCQGNTACTLSFAPYTCSNIA